MNEGPGVKQQIVERVKQSSNILVTVSTNPSVDELSAALGLTIMLNNMSKHATAVVSGVIPPAITFLDPEKTFENTVDSLRDFIIALDKEKADHLRYKVDGDVVKIFITPYRTTISEADLDFSQGDYNVELVLALGVRDKSHLDKALESHGRILHDATVATLSCEGQPSDLGSLNWHEAGASSISEMLVALSEALKTDKPVLDEQTATAFLTGIVAATDRFSNDKTSSKVMTMAAQLMAAGANQQLIAAKLEEAHEISTDTAPKASQRKAAAKNSDGTTTLSEGESTKLDKKRGAKQEKADKPDGTLAVSHEREGSLDEVAKAVQEEKTKRATEKAETVLEKQLLGAVPAAGADTPSVADLQKDLAAASAEVDEAAAEDVATAAPAPSLSTLEMPDYEPTLGGTLNATTQQASEEKRKAAEHDQNKAILSHVQNTMPTDSAPLYSGAPFSDAVRSSSPASKDDVAGDDSAMATVVPPLQPLTPDPVASASAPRSLSSSPFPAVAEPAAEPSSAVPHEEARAAVEAAFGSAPFSPAGQPIAAVGAQPMDGPDIHAAEPAAAPGLPPLPPLPDFPAPPPPPPVPDFGIASAPAAPTPVLPAEPAAVASQAEPLGQIFPDQPVAAAPAEAQNSQSDFKIPGQA